VGGPGDRVEFRQRLTLGDTEVDSSFYGATPAG
jgi:hypothetical protein